MSESLHAQRVTLTCGDFPSGTLLGRLLAKVNPFRKGVLRMTWSCDAYGPEGLDIGALCFVADQNERRCKNELECRITMQQSRRRLFERLLELAEQGDETSLYVLETVRKPEDLLTAPDARWTGEDRKET